MYHLLLAAFFCALLASPLTCHAEDRPAISRANEPADHPSCREIADLAKKYGVDRKLSDSVLVDGKPCPRGEAAACLLAIMEKVQEKCQKEGKDAVPREDLDRIVALHEALKAELAQYEGYQTRRESIEALLAKPDEPAFEYKYGVNGFLRGDVTDSLHLSDNRFTPGHGEGRLVYRVKPYVYWHPTEWLGFHAEGQGYGFTGGRNQEYNKLSLYQGYLEAKLPGSELLAMRGGRQELTYGSAFILGADSFFDGLTYDAVRLRFKPAEPLTVDLFGGAYARPFSGGVEGTLAGVYAAYAISEGTGVEAYALHDTGSVNRNAGEYLNIWGLRGTAKAGPASLEFEPVLESGRLYSGLAGADDRINSYGGHVDLNVDTTMAGLHNHFIFSYALGSGSGAAANGLTAKKEFRNPNNDTSLVGDMHVIADLSGLTVNGRHASGLRAYALGWGVDFTKDVNFTATGRYFMAANSPAGFSRDLGIETDFILTWNVADGLSLIAGYDRFFTGAFFRDASGSGKDIDYGYLMVQFDISKSKPRLKPVKG